MEKCIKCITSHSLVVTKFSTERKKADCVLKDVSAPRLAEGVANLVTESQPYLFWRQMLVIKVTGKSFRNRYSYSKNQRENLLLTRIKLLTFYHWGLG